jgi:Flp pilus assembly protein TadG
MHARGFKSESGQALTEFAVVLPLLAIILVAIVQAGIALNHYVTLTDAVRVGARTASASASLGPAGATTATTTAMQQAAGGLPLEEPAVDSDWQSGHPVTVSASVPYDITIFGVPVVSGKFTSTTTQRVE